MDPINYTGSFTGLQSPNASFVQGLQGGAAVQQLQLQQQQAAMAQQQQLQMRSDLQALSQNPTTQAIGQMSVKYPQLSENFKRSFDMLAPAQQQAKLDHATQVYAALQNGEPAIAQKILTDQAAALRNSGNENDAKAAETMASLIEAHPEFAQTTAGLMISSAMGPDKFSAAFPAIGKEQRDQGLYPSVLSKSESDAATAGTDATVAQSTAQAKIDKAELDNRLAQFDAQIKAATSETQRGQLTLERDKFIADQKLKTNTQSSDAQTHLDGLNQSLSTVDALIKHPGLSSGTGLGSSVTSFFNGTDAKDFRLQLETLKSQEFLTAAKELKGMGALSNAEGERLEKAISSLDPNQSTSQFKTSLGVIRSNLVKAQNKLIAGGKLPTQGGGFIVKHPVYGNVNEGDINRLLTQFPGSTRDQVIQYLNGTK